MFGCLPPHSMRRGDNHVLLLGTQSLDPRLRCGTHPRNRLGLMMPNPRAAAAVRKLETGLQPDGSTTFCGATRTAAWRQTGSKFVQWSVERGTGWTDDRVHEYR